MFRGRPRWQRVHRATWRVRMATVTKPSCAMSPDPPPTARLALASATPLAVGHLRYVFQHPECDDALIKIMRADAVASRWNAPARWHKRLPRTRHYIGYLRELKEYIGARARAPDVDAPIARMIGVVDT